MSPANPNEGAVHVQPARLGGNVGHGGHEVPSVAGDHGPGVHDDTRPAAALEEAQPAGAAVPQGHRKAARVALVVGKDALAGQCMVGGPDPRRHRDAAAAAQVGEGGWQRNVLLVGAVEDTVAATALRACHRGRNRGGGGPAAGQAAGGAVVGAARTVPHLARDTGPGALVEQVFERGAGQAGQGGEARVAAVRGPGGIGGLDPVVIGGSAGQARQRVRDRGLAGGSAQGAGAGRDGAAVGDRAAVGEADGGRSAVARDAAEQGGARAGDVAGRAGRDSR